MREYERACRVGMAAVLLALCLRLLGSDVPGQLAQYAGQLYISAAQQPSETGQDVRFSPSFGVFSPDFAESFPAASKAVPLPPIPVFSGEEAVEITSFAAKDPDIPALLAKPLHWDLYGSEPTVLILHTHSTESYTKNKEVYDETSSWRTLDENYNMLSIGAHLAQLLQQAGIPTVQDRSLHDYPSYNGSYVDARESIRTFLEEYPSIRLILDLHRDASGSGGRQMRTQAEVDGEASAQLMVVLGTNYERYEENLSLGLKLHVLLERENRGITRPLQLRTQRFNQDLSPGALLIEVGAAGNSHSEAMKAAEALAKAVIDLAKGSQS